MKRQESKTTYYKFLSSYALVETTQYIHPNIAMLDSISKHVFRRITLPGSAWSCDLAKTLGIQQTHNHSEEYTN